MSNISNMDLKELLLQHNITDKDIKGSGKNRNVLKSDRIKVYTTLQTKETAKIITIKGQDYTEDDLYMMIQYYNQHNIKPVDQGNKHGINEDIWLNILLQSDMRTLKTACMTNKITNKICNKDDFWQMKFNQDELFVPKKFKTLDDWIMGYLKVKDAVKVAGKLINYLRDKKKNYFNIIGINEDHFDLDKVNFLTPNINKAIKVSENDVDRSLEFDVEDLNIVYMYIPVDVNGDYGDDYITVVDPVTKEEFITSLAKIFYHFPKVSIMNQPEIDDSEENIIEDFVILSYHQLVHKHKVVKTMLPEW